MRFDPRWRDEVLILLARDPKAEEQLLSLDQHTAQWIAVNDLLLRMKSRPLFVRMLERTRIEHFCEVFDSEAPAGQIGGTGSGPGGWQIPLRKVPAGFPPVGVYALQTRTAAGTTVLAWGPCSPYGTVTYSRTEIKAAGTEITPRTDPRAGKSIECCNAYLAAFEGMPQAAVEILRLFTRIRWTNAASFSREANEAMDTNARALREFVRQARIAGIELPTTVTIQPLVWDRRTSKRVRLPGIAPRGQKPRRVARPPGSAPRQRTYA